MGSLFTSAICFQTVTVVRPLTAIKILFCSVGLNWSVPKNFILSCQVYLNRQPNPRKKLLVPCVLDKPNPKCYVCRENPEVAVKLNPTTITVRTLQDKVLEILHRTPCFPGRQGVPSETRSSERAFKKYTGCRLRRIHSWRRDDHY